MKIIQRRIYGCGASPSAAKAADWFRSVTDGLKAVPFKTGAALTRLKTGAALAVSSRTALNRSSLMFIIAGASC